MRIDRQRLTLWLYLLVLVGLLRGAFFVYNLQVPLAAGEGALMVQPGQSLTQVADALAAQGVLRHPFDFLLYARLSGQADSIRAGEYGLTPGMTPRDLLRKLVNGEVLVHQIRILEGWTAAQALAALQANPYIRSTIPAGDAQTLRDALDLETHPEGQFFPDTYNFTRGTTDREILRRAHALMQRVLDEAWRARDVGLPFDTPYDALILASLVEKETGKASERALIAGVFVRRLREGMRLQTDPSVIYGLGVDFDGNLTRAHLGAENPYNTYRNRGLPPTPIALPGREAIAAALHPDDSGALYFVGKGDGSHHFSATLEEHNAAVRRYQVEARAPDYDSRPRQEETP